MNQNLHSSTINNNQNDSNGKKNLNTARNK
jgi:hypothetical protein